MRKLNKKINEDLFEISANFVPEKGVSYWKTEGVLALKGDEYPANATPLSYSLES